ncbi:MAG: aldo/keto reductase [Pseudonocardiales bacterium]|nr:aldo/keto reductase [Pseudonocardiales bacterium]MBV9029278.1 aldo/keto reductase [Pseudonocardiales bacterium]MBW0009743.1 aldo/keto reductase [Pseudonocardiales bacterium]
MRYRQLGESGLTVSVIGLGGNNFGGRLGLEETRGVVDAAIDCGVTLVDTADIYGNRGGSEELLGQVLAGRREHVVLATKFGMDMGDGTVARGSRRYIRRAVEASLRRLRTDYIDLYQYHQPDGVTPLEETLATLDDLVTEGRVCYIGSSNFAGWQIADADWIARTRHRARFVSAQNYYNLLRRDAEREIIPSCVNRGVSVLPYFPLANGLLTGKYRRGQAPPRGTRLAGREPELTGEVFDKLEALERFGEKHGRSLLDVAVAGLAAMPAVASVIAGATKPEQVRANATAGEWELSSDELAELRSTFI